MNRVLITGGAGFIGSVIANHLAEIGFDVEILDCLTYAADTSRLNNQEVILHDIIKPIVLDRQYEYILHLAAETHVDNSIIDPMKFVMTNFVGTAHMLEFARKQKNLKMFLYFSTDEVFGPAPKFRECSELNPYMIGACVDGSPKNHQHEFLGYKEWDRYNSGNPYSATKAGGEELTLSYGNTYKLPVVVTHTMNAFGPTQHKEKFIPSTVNKILRGETVIIHADSTKKISGSRFYIHTRNIASAVEFVMQNAPLQDKYNIVGEREVSNLEVAQMIAQLLHKPLKYKMVDFHSSRPGHDLRYALDGEKLRNMGWNVEDTFEKGLKETVEYYVKQN